MVYLVISVIGILAAIIALIATGPLFKKQRRKLLDQIERE